MWGVNELKEVIMRSNLSLCIRFRHRVVSHTDGRHAFRSQWSVHGLTKWVPLLMTLSHLYCGSNGTSANDDDSECESFRQNTQSYRPRWIIYVLFLSNQCVRPVADVLFSHTSPNSLNKVEFGDRRNTKKTNEKTVSELRMCTIELSGEWIISLETKLRRVRGSRFVRGQRKEKQIEINLGDCFSSSFSRGCFVGIEKDSVRPMECWFHIP